MPNNQINTPARRTVSSYSPDIANGLSPGETAFGWARDGDMLHEGQHWEETPIVYVAWTAGGTHDTLGQPGDSTLQIAMHVDCEEVLRAADEIRRNRELATTGAGVDQMRDWRFNTVVLTRPEAQMLIRTAKRARDAVFGADE